MGQGWVARTQDNVVLEVYPQFLLEFLFDVNLGHDPKSLLLQLFGDHLHRLVEGKVDLLFESVAYHGFLLSDLQQCRVYGHYDRAQ